MLNRTRTLLLLAAIALSAPVGAPAFAQEAPSEEALADARASFQQGNSAYLEGRYRDAIAAFERANRIVPNPRLIEYIARCYTNLGDAVRAIESYRAYAATSEAAAAEVADTLEMLVTNARINAVYQASDTVLDALARARGETPPPRDLQRQELGTRMRDVVVQIRSEPRGAEVYIDAIELGAVGVTPLETPLFTGRHFIEVRREHYAPANRVVNVTIPDRGESIPVFEFELERLQVPVLVTATPSTARITFIADDGTRVDMGIGSWEGTLPAGPGAFVLQAAGRDRRIEHVVTAPDSGGTAEISLALEEQVATGPRPTIRVGRVVVLVEQLAGAEVLVDGRAIGTSPGSFEAEVTAGWHTIELRADGFETWRQDVEVTGDGELRIYGPPALTRARRR